jgi:two-component system, sensor histidine kinase
VSHEPAPSDEPIRVELGRAMRRQAPISALSAACMAAFIAWLAWDQAQHGAVIAWLLVVILLKVVQLTAQTRFFPLASSDVDDARHWERYFLGFVAATGVAWAATPFLFLVPGDPPPNTFIVAALVALGAGSVPALMYQLRTMIVFLALVFVPLAVRLLLLDHPAQAALAVGSLVFMAAFGRIQGRVARESIRLRHENVDLVTSLRLQKAATESALRLAEEANKAKSRFFSAASHDLRQPLHALALFSASLREMNPEPERRAVVDQVYASIEALESLFDEVLDLSKLDTGYVVPRPTHFPIARLLDALERQFGPVAGEAGLDLRVAACRATVYSDATLLTRILANLVANAIRYTPAGTVLLGCRRHGGALRVEVWDTGLGIPFDAHDRIFEEFHQLGNPERDRRKGLGLGLATVRRLTDLLGHSLALRSAVGRGSVFRLDVPLGDPAGVGAAVAPAAAEVDLLRGKRIVVVDDEPSVRHGMEELLTRWGCSVIAAADGAQALRALAAVGAPDVIICDQRLAGAETGTAVIERLRARYGAGIPAMLITADMAAQRSHEANPQAHLWQQKPVRPAQLRAACNQLLSRRASA